MKLVLTAAADADLRGIFRYSRREFGTAQAQRYVAAINARMRVILKSPQIGRRFDEIDDDYRLVSCQSHHIYFRRVADELRVVRILHQRMDERAHLPQS